jgi:hypothetical protein
VSERSNRVPRWSIILLVILLCTILALPALAGQLGSETNGVDPASTGESSHVDPAGEVAVAESAGMKDFPAAEDSSGPGVRWGMVLAVIVVVAIVGYLSYRKQQEMM